MAVKVTIGGNRLGAGGKMTQKLPGFGRSTHDLGRTIATTMAPGVLVPIVCEITKKGDRWDIDIEKIIKTLPLNGPLFSSYKVQVDVFEADMRLYNAQMHNNPYAIGRTAEKILLPQMKIGSRSPIMGAEKEPGKQQINPASLLKYCGISSVGQRYNEDYEAIERRFFAGFPIMYYDIYKNNYANHQEGVGYVIEPAVQNSKLDAIENCRVWDTSASAAIFTNQNGKAESVPEQNLFYKEGGNEIYLSMKNGVGTTDDIPRVLENCRIRHVIEDPVTLLPVYQEDYAMELFDKAVYDVSQAGLFIKLVSTKGTNLRLAWGTTGWIRMQYEADEVSEVRLKEFPLENIDKMREDILAYPKTSAFTLGSGLQGMYEPYSTNWEAKSWLMNPELSVQSPQYPMQGLCVKTYQSDLFNNWLDKEYIAGNNR